MARQSIAATSGANPVVLGATLDDLTIGDVTLNSRESSVSVEGKSVQLSDRAYLVAVYLLIHEQELCTRKALLSDVWGITAPVVTRRVDVQVSVVRQALESLGSEYTVRTVAFKGYVFEQKGAVPNIEVDLNDRRQDDLTFGDVTLIRRHSLMLFNGKSVHLSQPGYLLAAYLLQNAGKLCSRKLLLRDVWGITGSLVTRRVDMQISLVRRAFETLSVPYAVRTVPNKGYVLEEVRSQALVFTGSPTRRASRATLALRERL